MNVAEGRMHGSLLVALLIISLIGNVRTLSAGSDLARATSSDTIPPCNLLNSSADLRTGHAPDIQVVGQGYRCLLAHYIDGHMLDDRTLLRSAFTTLLTDFGSGSTGATLGHLTGDHNADWQVFAGAYSRLATSLGSNSGLLQSMAQVSLQAMAGALNDSHTTYLPAYSMKPLLAELDQDAPEPTFGLYTSPLTGTTDQVYITDVLSGTPAARAGLRPGDIIEKVNGTAAIDQGVPSEGLIGILLPQLDQTEQLQIERPATSSTFQCALVAVSRLLPVTSARLLQGNIGYVKLYAFTAGAASAVFKSLKQLDPPTSLRAVILDLRGNGGGYADQAVQLLSAFVHHTTVAFQISGNGHSVPQATDDDIPLLHVPLAVLVDAGSASSSELLAAAVQDLHAGVLVGTRTAGALAGAEFFGLSDGSGLEITEVRLHGALDETIDGIGVIPAHIVDTSAGDLSRGIDPAITSAIRLLSATSAGMADQIDQQRGLAPHRYTFGERYARAAYGHASSVGFRNAN